MPSKRGAILALAIFAGLASAQIRLRPYLDLGGETSDPGISRDGKTLAFQWLPADESKWGLYAILVSGGEPRLFVSREAGLAVNPAWSPDGRRVAFIRWVTPRTAALFIRPAAGGAERPLATVCNSEMAWAADGRALIATDNGNTDAMENCRIVGVPIDKREPPWELAHRGLSPAISRDGSTLAYIRGSEIHLIPLTQEGKAAGPDSRLVREQLSVGSLAWLPGSSDLIYVMSPDRSIVRRIEARTGAKPRDAGNIDGEFLEFAFAKGGPTLGCIYVHDDSYWRIDLQTHNPHFEKLRQLPWNVYYLSLAPDSQSLRYTVYSLARTVFYTSKIDGSMPRRLFSIPYVRISQPAWSPDGKQFAFTGEPYERQVAPSHLFVAPVNGPATRLLPHDDQVYGQVEWSPDGKALWVDDRKVDLPQPAGRATRAQNYIYFRGHGRAFLTLMRKPVAGGPWEPVLDQVQNYAIAPHSVYFIRRDVDGLNLHRLDLDTKVVSQIAHVETTFGPFQVSPDGRYIYAEKHQQPRQRIMAVEGLR